MDSTKPDGSPDDNQPDAGGASETDERRPSIKRIIKEMQIREHTRRRRFRP